MRYYFIIALTVAALGLTPCARAQTPEFIQPAACSIGTECWIVNYVDADPEKDKAADFRCGHRSYDDHNGTDFGLADQKTMQRGVDVLAAADGKVLRIRDSMEDKIASPEARAKMLADDTGCGNGVYIDHGGGWQTIYCHMKRGSISVKPNQSVKAGDKIGRIGNSGIAEFPHLHFGVFFEGHTLDPFTGRDNKQGCGGAEKPLWDRNAGLAYEPVIIYEAGFAPDAPDFEVIKQDSQSPDTLPANSKALTLWTGIFGAAKGDQITLEIFDPAGRLFARREMVQEKDRARQFYFTGRKISEGQMIKGTYTGHIVLKRTLENGKTAEKTHSSTIVIKE